LRGEVQALLDGAGEPPTDPAPTDPAPTDPEPTDPAPTEPAPVLRYAGDSRYATAADIAAETFPGPVEAVFLASGQAFPDALSGGPAAARQDAPVLLVRPDSIPEQTVAALQRLQPRSIYVVGGESAIAPAVLQQAQQYAPVVQRLSGANRYATAVAVSRQFWQSSATVYVASGDTYPDALSGGALAARTSSPILLSGEKRLPAPVAEELSRLAPASVVLLGGPSALDERVLTQVSALVPAAVVQRVAGPDRYATSAAIAQRGWPGETTRTYVAAGANFPDALSGVPAAARSGAPLVLSRRGCLPRPVQEQLTRLSSEETVLLGGADVLAAGALTRTCR
jgi:putative cell wall-binding protein